MGLLEKQFDIWKLERMWKMGEPQVCPTCEGDGIDSVCSNSWHRRKELDALRQRNAELLELLMHAAQRNHEYALGGCSACERIYVVLHEEK